MFGNFETGATAFFASQSDQRFSYCLYVPKNIENDVKLRLLVVVHGSRRTAEMYRDLCREFADEQNMLVLCPLFPVGIPTPEDTGGYKFLLDNGIRYDQILLSMVDEVAGKYPVQTEKFYLHGFSGGGQFANRFLYVWPHRLAALSVGAPGLVTLMNDADWWVGTRDIASVFGTPMDLAAISEVPVQILVGEEDLDSSEITLTEASRYWAVGANAAGENRVVRAQSLYDNWRPVLEQLQFDRINGVGHNGFEILPQVFDFFRVMMDDRRER